MFKNEAVNNIPTIIFNFAGRCNTMFDFVCENKVIYVELVLVIKNSNWIFLLKAKLHRRYINQMYVITGDILGVK